MVCPIGSHACAWPRLKHFIPWKRVRKRSSSSGLKLVLLYSTQKMCHRPTKKKEPSWDHMYFRSCRWGRTARFSQDFRHFSWRNDISFSNNCLFDGIFLLPQQWCALPAGHILAVTWIWAVLPGKGSLFLACTMLSLIELWSLITEPEKYLTGRKNTTGRLSTFSLPHFHQLLLSSFIMLNDFSSLFKYLKVSMLLLRQTRSCFCNVFLLQSSSSLSVAVLWVASSLSRFFWYCGSWNHEQYCRHSSSAWVIVWCCPQVASPERRRSLKKSPVNYRTEVCDCMGAVEGVFVSHLTQLLTKLSLAAHSFPSPITASTDPCLSCHFIFCFFYSSLSFY